MRDSRQVKRISECKSYRLDYLCDVDAVELAQSGDPRAFVTILQRYQDFVRLKARPYYLVGADHEDIIQEGMIGLYKAILDYRGDRETSFRAFAEICITRQIITAIKTATRQKHGPLNSYVSISSAPGETGGPDCPETNILATSELQDPAELVIGREEAQSIRDNFGKRLSPLEGEVLRLYVEGHSYQEIASKLDRHVKSIDNALQRIKRKVEQHLRYRESLVREDSAETGGNTHSVAV